MSFSEARMSRDAGIDYGGYDNDGSAGISQEAFLEDRLDDARFRDVTPGNPSDPWWARLATNGIPAAIDAASRAYSARQMAMGQNAGTFAGPNGRTYTTPVRGAPLAANAAPMGGSGGLLLMLGVGALLFVALRD
jgi:hypothetical protein